LDKLFLVRQHFGFRIRKTKRRGKEGDKFLFFRVGGSVRGGRDAVTPRELKEKSVGGITKDGRKGS